MMWKPLVALALIAVQPTLASGQVREVSVLPADGDTEIVVTSDASVEAREFLLAEPSRLIIDLHGASVGDLRGAYDGIDRGGVVGLRTSQFRSDVVRLVFDLAELPSYETAASEGRFVVRFPNPGEEFEAWSSTGREQVLAMEDRSPEPTVSGRPADARPSLQEVPARITVAYDSAAMLDVLAAFSEFAGVSIVPSSAVADLTVRGVDIRDQRWDVALDAILASQGLGWRMQSEGILIVDQLEGLRTRDTLQTQTRVFRINYASADSVANTLAQLATPQRGQVVGYQGSNSVIVTDVPSVVARMDTLVQSLDRQTPQVSIEAKIIFVDRTDVNSLGIVYDLKDRTGNSINEVIAVPGPEGELTNETLVDLTGESIAALANANDRILTPSLQILATTAFGNFSLAAFLDALEQHQLSDVQAAPSIQVVDNHSARIQVGERTPIRVLEQGAQAAGATVAVQFEDTGIILEVTPHVTNNNQILLDVEAERSGVQTDLPDVGFNFTQQLGQTRLLLDNGETMVIGGLTLSEVDRNESGIPFLMDIPVLGALFRTTNNTERKQDLIILVTPHIVE
ncbi:MAG: secretin N-terminal domain-containing protein [Gemmatimonadota bacterium]